MPCQLIAIGANRLPGSRAFGDVFNVSASRTLFVKRGIVVTSYAETTVADESAGDPGTLNKFALVTHAADTLYTATSLA